MIACQDIRTGDIKERIRETRKKVNLEDFMEDFIEALDEVNLLDPESETHDYRSRIKTSMREGLYLNASTPYLNSALREVVRNAIMYSLVGTPVTIVALPQREQCANRHYRRRLRGFGKKNMSEFSRHFHAPANHKLSVNLDTV